MRYVLSRAGGLGVAALAALLVSAAIAGPASAKVTWSGIGGVKLGMSDAALRAKLGSASSVTEAHVPGSRRHVYRRHKLTVTTFEGRVVAVVTTSRAERTAGGVGVGVSEKAMRRKVRGESCSTARGRRVCSVERSGRVMEFVCRRGRVVSVGLSRTG